VTGELQARSLQMRTAARLMSPGCRPSASERVTILPGA
jgi:hypothetical protein